MNRILRWLDERSGYQKIVQDALEENVPGGSRWRYVWGSTLVFTLAIQMITGLFLWMSYSPSSQTAWASVYYIQHELQGGWLLRGLHHFSAQLMILLLGAHVLQVVLDGAYRAPRELNFWFGLILLHLVLGLSLTGYLLPWDQKGYWATKVATNIFGIAPLVGDQIQRLLMGGPEYGHYTLTRFFALHAGVLPALVVLLLVGHVYLFRRHGITVKDPKRKPDEKFWPDQVLKDAAACLVVLLVLVALIFRHKILQSHGPLGAELGAPADPTEPYSAARPEWYFLFMFQFLKLFPGGTEVWGAIVIPNLVLIGLFLMPVIARWSWGHRLNLAALFGLILGIVLLTFFALRQDRRDPNYQAAVQEAEREAERARVLAQSPQGIPVEGGLALLHHDSLTQGPKLFAKNCASCHRYDNHDGLGKTIAENQTGAELKGFASRAWLTEFLDPKWIRTPKYYGGTAFTNGTMARFVRLKVAKFAAEDQENLKKVILALSAEAQLPAQRAADARDTAVIQQGRELLRTNKLGCLDCHRYQEVNPQGTAPDLTAYGSKAWLTGIVHNPADSRYYGQKNDRMPAFGEQRILDARSLGLVADWLRGVWYEPSDEPSLAAAQTDKPATNGSP